MTLLDLRAHIIQALNDRLPTALAGKVKVEAHPGRFELAEIERYAVRAPCIRVAVLTATDKELSEPLLGVELAAYLLTKSGKAGLPDAQNLTLASLALPIIRAPGALDTDDAGSPQAVVYRNLYNSSLGDEGIALGAITWRQMLSLPEMLSLPAADADQPLGSFQMLLAQFDLGPEPDSQIEATTKVTLEGAAA